MKFIHTADIHLDSPLTGLQDYEGAPVEEIRGAARRAFENLIETAVKEEVDFILISGDLYDGDWQDYNTGLYFSKQMSKLREQGIRAFIIHGNHDAASRITKTLKLPDNVKTFSYKNVETEIIEELKVAVHGRSYPVPAVTDDLSIDYPDAVQGYFNIGLLHTCMDGQKEHDPYAPCKAENLINKNYDYWALGHVHKFEEVNKDPRIVFPGNLQGRHIREGGRKGFVLVEVTDGRIESAIREYACVLIWETCRVDASGCKTPEDIIDRLNIELNRIIAVNPGIFHAVRVEITGKCKAHTELISDSQGWINQIRADSTDLSGGNIWVEKVKIKTGPELDISKTLERDDAVGDLMRAIRDIDTDSPVVDNILNELKDLLQKLPSEIKSTGSTLDLNNPDTVSDIIEEVRNILISRLQSGEEV